jgi:hypothetical protein
MVRVGRTCSIVAVASDPEKDCIVKQAPALTYSALYPSNIGRQNVKLALKVFYQKNIPTWKSFGSQSGANVTGTVEFFQLLGSPFKMFKVKSVDKGRRKRDSLSDPVMTRLTVNKYNIWRAYKMAGRLGNFESKGLTGSPL